MQQGEKQGAFDDKWHKIKKCHQKFQHFRKPQTFVVACNNIIIEAMWL